MHLDLLKILFFNQYLNIRLVRDDLIKYPKKAFLVLHTHTFQALTRKRLGEFYFFKIFFMSTLFSTYMSF